MFSSLVKFCLERRPLVVACMAALIVGGLIVSPFPETGVGLPRSPVSVDALPQLGEPQQIIVSEWPGRSPQDVEDQITYPLSVFLMGISEVETVRAQSSFGLSSVTLIFEEGVSSDRARSRVSERLASIPGDLIPEGVRPALGPDATALGQVFWYTIEGRDEEGRPAGSWSLDEVRSVQDWVVRPALLAANGVAEVASVGGFVREYQVDVDPNALRVHRVALTEVMKAVAQSNREVGARTVEINRVEYFVRGTGWIQSPEDIEQAPLRSVEGVPLRVVDVARVTVGPALRRGALDKGGAETVGGVVVSRIDANPMEVIDAVKEAMATIAPALPSRSLADGRTSQLTIVPFYDRTGLILETLGTLWEAMTLQVLVTVVVVLVMLRHLQSSLLISSLLPLAVFFAFACMKVMGVEANIVALSGIAIAVGTMVDMGIVITENIYRHLGMAPEGSRRSQIVHRAVVEVGPAVMTATATTIISFLPVFTLTGVEGRLFRPLAATKTFALLGALAVAILFIPAASRTIFSRRRIARPMRGISILLTLGAVGLLSWLWEPLGAQAGLVANVVLVLIPVGGLLGVFALFRRAYPTLLSWSMEHKGWFLLLPLLVVFSGLLAWKGWAGVLGPVTGGGGTDSERHGIRATTLWVSAENLFPGLGSEFMPRLDEGSYLFMPTTMPHASLGEALDVLSHLDRAIESIPEVDLAVGKVGRAESALDPAPINMVETVVQILPEYRLDENGHRATFQFDEAAGVFSRDSSGELLADSRGRPYRNWRPAIKEADDIWEEIVAVARLPGTTGAPRLQPIAARLVMLQTGMRAPMGVQIKGPTLEALQQSGLSIEQVLRGVPGVDSATVFADRIVGKPYLEIDVDRKAAARFGLSVVEVQDVIEMSIGGRRVTNVVSGRERIPVRVRYMREQRGTVDDIKRIAISAPSGAQVPLGQLATIRSIVGPQAIRTEDTFLTSYVTFDKEPGYSEVEVVESCREALIAAQSRGTLPLLSGVSWEFVGSFEHHLRASRTLALVIPAVLLVVLVLLYLQFRRMGTAFMVFAGVLVAWGGGFLLLWLYGQSWFADFSLLGINARELFHVNPVHLSVAVWVGFLALFGIATDDGVVLATYLDQSFKESKPRTRKAVRQAVLTAGERRIRPCLMTTATTMLALLPVLSSTGRGSDIMVPMAIPIFGGMVVEFLTMLIVPVLYSMREERRLARSPEAST